MKKAVLFCMASFCFGSFAYAQSPAAVPQTANTQNIPANAQVQPVVPAARVTVGAPVKAASPAAKVQTAPKAAPKKVSSRPIRESVTTYPSSMTPGIKSQAGLYGDYMDSEYQNDFQTEMLRHTVWGSLVPRKKLFDDPAKGRYPLRYTVRKAAVKDPCADQNQQKTASPAQSAKSNEEIVKAILKNTEKEMAAEQSSKNPQSQSFYEPVKPETAQNNQEVQKKVEEIQQSLTNQKVEL